MSAHDEQIAAEQGIDESQTPDPSDEKEWIDWTPRIHHEISLHIEDAKGNHIATTVLLVQPGGWLWLTDVWSSEETRRKGAARAIMLQVMEHYGDRPMMLRAEAYADRPVHGDALVAFYKEFGFEESPLPSILTRPANSEGK